jgi:radical SAM superfamily enzyme YgiQ (UPF0313 family)
MAPRVLLSSVFKPFGVDNIYSRKDSKVELYHNQLTKVQGVFSMRAFMNTYGLHAIARNLPVPCTVLDFPTLARFRRELKQGYDYIGIGAIMPNFQKVKRMVEEAREISPRSTIVVGGFCATIPNIKELLGVDHVCVGEGITFMRELLGLPLDFTFQNPDIFAESRELFGVPIFGIKNPHIIVGLGCSYGCDFCCPSHFFGRRHLKFYTRGEPLFEEMLRVEKRFRSNLICFIGDDNFLLDLKRAEELRQCVVKSGRVYNNMIFGSADKVMEFGPERLAEMGVGIIWIGRESKYYPHRKLEGAQMKEVVAELQRLGIKVILSSILLLDQHTKENIHGDIDEHLACRPVFSQFSHYSPAPGTPLYERMVEEGRIYHWIPLEEWHAFKQPWFYHPAFSLLEAEHIQNLAYERDFHELGPSLLRYIAVEFEGFQNLKNSPKPHLRARAEFFARQMWKYKIMLAAMDHLAPTAAVRELVREVRARVESSFGPADFLSSGLARGLQATSLLRQLRTRLFGDTLQPPTRRVKYNQDAREKG